jgi:hypothetical protein
MQRTCKSHFVVLENHPIDKVNLYIRFRCGWHGGSYRRLSIASLVSRLLVTRNRISAVNADARCRWEKPIESFEGIGYAVASPWDRAGALGKPIDARRPRCSTARSNPRHGPGVAMCPASTRTAP